MTTGAGAKKVRSVERGMVERVEVALETVELLAHAAHDRYSRRGYRRMAARADPMESLRAE